MESFAIDRSLYDVGENDLKDIWESDFHSSIHDGLGTEPDWNTILEVGNPVILNDRMITDALQSPRITSEHSYSLVNSDDVDMPDSPLGTPLVDQDLESECFPAIPMASATTNGNMNPVEAYVKQEPISPPGSPQMSSSSSSSSMGSMSSSQSLLKQPTIILATRHAASTSNNSRCVLYPKVNIKLEPTPYPTESKVFPLPLTPPSSTSSDSEGSLSPVHNQQPSSPNALGGTLYSPPRRSVSNSGGSRSLASNAALISTQPKGATGVLSLTDEEKRTLIAEGYPIPSRLPLTKTEEKSLKKIRRKIKNKISAQESRRKKKEYTDALEKRVEILAYENTEHKKKLETLETNNTSLLMQLQRLQALISNIPNKMARNVSTQTTQTLTVVLFCFAIFLGSWGPLHFIRFPHAASHGELSETARGESPLSSFWGPAPRSQDQYATHIKPSRTLLAFLEEERDARGESLLHQPETAADTMESSVLSRSIRSFPEETAWQQPDVSVAEATTPAAAANTTLARHVFIKASVKQG